MIRVRGVDIPLPTPQKTVLSRPKSSEGQKDLVRLLVGATQKKTSSPPPDQKQIKRPEGEELKRLVEELQRRFDLMNKQLKIEIDHELGIPVVKIIDKQTNEVIRQIPPEYMLKIMKNIDRMLGLLVNERI